MFKLSNLRNYYSVYKLRNGKTAHLSIADVVKMLIHIPSAKRNLSSQTYTQVYQVYRGFTHAIERKEITFYDFQILSWKIIAKFNDIAPFEKYAAKNYKRLLSTKNINQGDDASIG